MNRFIQNTTTKTEIKVMRGMIPADENELLCKFDLFYWANFIPHHSNNTTYIMGEYEFADENVRFIYEYNTETDTIFIRDYRLHICSPELYEKYYLNIKYIVPRNDETLVIPWKRFPRTKNGFAIPQLIEKILGKIPNKMVFM